MGGGQPCGNGPCFDEATLEEATLEALEPEFVCADKDTNVKTDGGTKLLTSGLLDDTTNSNICKVHMKGYSSVHVGARFSTRVGQVTHLHEYISRETWMLLLQVVERQFELRDRLLHLWQCATCYQLNMVPTLTVSLVGRWLFIAPACLDAHLTCGREQERPPAARMTRRRRVSYERFCAGSRKAIRDVQEPVSNAGRCD